MENEEWLECEKFYELMQAYRLAPFSNQAVVVKAFLAVKQYIREHMKVKG